MNYHGYTVCVGNDPCNYGSCTDAQALKIADTLEAMIEDRFPGITIRRTPESGSPTPTRGPDCEVVDEIDAWVADNWMAAL